jgi:hypothetical protein
LGESLCHRRGSYIPDIGIIKHALKVQGIFPVFAISAKRAVELPQQNKQQKN